MAIKYCEHRLREGICEICWKPRNIETLWDAWKILRSGFGSHLEWCDAAEIFFSNGLEDEAETCSLFAINSLGKLPGSQRISWKSVLSIYIRGRLASDAVSFDGKLNFEKLASRLADARASIREIRSHRLNSDRNTASITEADVALSELIMLAKDSSKFSRIQLAAKFRKYSKGDKKFRWGRPEIAISIMDDYLRKYPEDTAALCVKASALADIGNWQAANVTAISAYELNKTDIVILKTVGRTYLGLLDGFSAWSYIYKALEIREDLPTVAMLLNACAISAARTDLSEAQRDLISKRKAFSLAIIERMPNAANKSGIANLNRITLKTLIFDGFFIEAIRFLSETIADGHDMNAYYWNSEIDSAIRRSGKSVRDVRCKADEIYKDLFPDIPSISN